jgi:uncharacterized protein (DUF2384 family)
MEAWGASDEQMRSIVGLRSVSILRRWRKQPPKALNPDHLRRIGTVLSIWKALNYVFGSPAAARHWIVNENASLGGRSPLEFMALGDIIHLDHVRNFAEHQTGGHA